MASTNDFKFDFSSIKSSARNEDFRGLSEKQIIEKYEALLVKREKEVKDISYQMGVVNEKYFDGLEKIKQLKKENDELDNKIIKITKLIENEKINKKIMNERISELTRENNELRKQRNNIIGKPDPLMIKAETEKKDIEKKKSQFKGLASEEIKYQLNCILFKIFFLIISIIYLIFRFNFSSTTKNESFASFNFI